MTSGGSPDHGQHGSPPDFAAVEGAVSSLRFECVRVNGPFEIGIDHGDVAGAADSQRPDSFAFKAEEPRGFDGHHRDEARPVDGAGVDERLCIERQRRLHPDDAERRFFKGPRLFCGGMRCVIRG